MVIKIYLEKAYDKLEWCFIRERLSHINMPEELIEIIMSCVSSVSTSILFNGGTLDLIFPLRSIRQGDPLSPYLFILCIDQLGQLIEGKCADKLWKLVKTLRNSPSFSHLFFADDLVLFAKANHACHLAIQEVLDVFCEKSGQTVSEAKSRVYFSPNVNVEMKDFPWLEELSLFSPLSLPSLFMQCNVPLFRAKCWITLVKSIGTSYRDHLSQPRSYTRWAGRKSLD